MIFVRVRRRQAEVVREVVEVMRGIDDVVDVVSTTAVVSVTIAGISSSR